ncbi:FAD-binding oxidoreductase [Actinocorallia sp. A-T 12471]|uniref:FAD-binding oxidoreductase n=1 Tax=Actinocorallia sp. A-T 12471 TaxID=3089813 RepID=UPI0029D05F5B|nr:FAD-binding oxidoreductase [Actinocorallia sp. A-T 12471]MDX6745020.1 FAD-binding oxidoreductase [Actinocorallia sp. A-T 12471]
MTGNDALGRDLRAAVRGRVLTAADEGFARAALGWSVGVPQRPVAVVEVADAADAAALVRHANDAGLALAVQPSGHGATTALDGAVIVRTGALRDVTIDPDARTATVGAGASCGELLEAAGAHGLTFPAGSSPAVSVAGYTLGGGLGWYGRSRGPASASVRALEIVDASGTARRVTAAADPDLFWALCGGGGGDHALVTALELDLFPAPALYGGRIIWPVDKAAEVLDAYAKTTAAAPEELSVWVAIMQFPPFPELPEPLRGLSAVVVDAAHLGEAEEGRALLAAFDAVDGVVFDTRGPLPPAALGSICAEPVEPMPSLHRGAFVTDLDGASGVLRDLAAGGTVHPLVFVQLRHLGGAYTRELPGARGPVAEPYLLSMMGVTPGEETAAAVRERIGAVTGAMAPFTTGRKPYTFLCGGESASDAFAPAVVERLREVKRAHDPQGIFRSNFPILD